MEDANKTRTTLYSGLSYEDPTGDIRRIKLCIVALANLIDDMYTVWDDATRIDHISIRQNVMERLSESIENLMNLVQSADRALIYELRDKEV